MAVTAFDYNYAVGGIPQPLWAGRWPYSANLFSQGIAGLTPGVNDELRFSFTLDGSFDGSGGTTLAVKVSGANQTTGINVSIDGGAATTVNLTGDLQFRYVNVATGLMSGTHTVTITSNASGW